MCGIAGIYNINGGSRIPSFVLKRMINIMRHRGPDDEGFVFIDNVKNNLDRRFIHYKNKEESIACGKNRLGYDIGLGHCRLSIIDLSEAGNHPMPNEDQTIWLVCNGEIYNFINLRSDLKIRGHVFKSNSDSEIIIHAYEEWGINCVEKFNGMWAFALWDGRKKRLFCARDRMGIKPFYWYFDGSRFVFASEIKAILANEFIERIPNDEIIWDYIVNEYVDHTEHTFFRHIKQLLPAHSLIIENNQLSIHRYWDLEKNVTLSETTDEKAAKQFYNLFEDSIRLRLQSEVPVGTCLSGGLDSSSIVCVIDRLLKRPGDVRSELMGIRQKTFSSCFDDRQFDERDFIREVVTKTSIDPKYIFPDGTDLLRSIDSLIWHQDEPFPSVRLFSQWNVMKLAKEHGVKVLLDGQGGDELLAGYHFFFQSYFEYLMQTLQFKKLIDEIKSCSILHNHSKYSIIKELLKFVTPNRILEARRHILKKKINKRDTYSWINEDFFEHNENISSDSNSINDSFKSSIYMYLTKYRLPSLLRYEDRNSMAFSIEARVPFLDYRLVEYIFSLHNTQIIQNGMTKFVLRNAMRNLLPEKILNRTDKMGFVVPEDYWLQRLNRDQITDIFASQSFKERGYFKQTEMLNSYDSFCSGQTNVNSSIIWRVLSLELWYRKFIDNKEPHENSIN